MVVCGTGERARNYEGAGGGGGYGGQGGGHGGSGWVGIKFAYGTVELLDGSGNPITGWPLEHY